MQRKKSLLGGAIFALTAIAGVVAAPDRVKAEINGITVDARKR